MHVLYIPLISCQFFTVKKKVKHSSHIPLKNYSTYIYTYIYIYIYIYLYIYIYIYIYMCVCVCVCVCICVYIYVYIYIYILYILYKSFEVVLMWNSLNRAVSLRKI